MIDAFQHYCCLAESCTSKSNIEEHDWVWLGHSACSEGRMRGLFDCDSSADVEAQIMSESAWDAMWFVLRKVWDREL